MSAPIFFRSELQKEVDWFIRIIAQSSSRKIDGLCMMGVSTVGLNTENINQVFRCLLPGTDIVLGIKPDRMFLSSKTINLLARALLSHPITRELYREYVRKSFLGDKPREKPQSARVKELEEMVAHLQAENEVIKKIADTKEKNLQKLRARRKAEKTPVVESARQMPLWRQLGSPQPLGGW